MWMKKTKWGLAQPTEESKGQNVNYTCIRGVKDEKI